MQGQGVKGKMEEEGEEEKKRERRREERGQEGGEKREGVSEGSRPLVIDIGYLIDAVGVSLQQTNF